MDRLTATVPKNKTEEIRFYLRHLNGKEFLDIREFAQVHGLGEKAPTGRGVAVPLALFEAFKKAVGDSEGAIRASEAAS